MAQADYGKVDQSRAFEFGQVVLVDELLWDVREFDVHVLWVFERSANVKVLDAKAHKVLPKSRQYAVDH